MSFFFNEGFPLTDRQDMSRVLRERVERVALRSESESVLQEPIEKGKVKFKHRIEDLVFGVAGREINPVPIEQFSCRRQNT